MASHRPGQQDKARHKEQYAPQQRIYGGNHSFLDALIVTDKGDVDREEYGAQGKERQTIDRQPIGNLLRTEKKAGDLRRSHPQSDRYRYPAYHSGKNRYAQRPADAMEQMRPGRDSLASLGTPERLGDLPLLPMPAGAPIFEQRLEYSSPEYATPRYAGNISETSWSRADTARMTYVYAYDRLGRLVDGHCTTGTAQSTKHYGERNITYDRNSNILSLDRYNGAIAATRYRYTYDGNRILTVGTCQTSPVGQTPVTEYAYRYDSMGNVAFNGAEALQVSYNYRNLPKRATKADMRAATGSASTYVVGVAPHVVQNIYLADGTKVRATDDRGRGYEYLGSLSRTFLSPRHSPNEFGSALGLTKRSLRLNVNREKADIESIPFAGGRIVKTSNGYEPHYYVTDHLGSTRAIVRPAASGVEIMAEYDYMPYGTQHIVAEAPTAEADYKYTGKEQQGAFGMYSLYDSQARFQNVTSGCFLSQDPLSTKFPETTPYIYCGADPINRADPDGKKWVDKNGNLIWKDGKWTKYASTQIQELGNTLRSSETGLLQFNKLVNNPAAIIVTINDTDTPNRYGIMKPYNKHAILPNASIYKLYQISPLTEIIVYARNANKRVKRMNDTLTTIESMAVNLGHEIEHTTDDNVTLNVRSVQDPVEVPNEKVEEMPNKIALQIAREYEIQKPIKLIEHNLFIINLR